MKAEKYVATLWAREQFGFGDWCPQSADEFRQHCIDCGFDVPAGLVESASHISCEYDLGTGYAPEVVDGLAIVARRQEAICAR